MRRNAVKVGEKRIMLSIIVVSKPQTIKNQIKVELVGDNFTELKGEIAGPPDTPYEGITSPPPSL